MDIVGEAWEWLLSAEQYQGPGSIPERVGEHLYFTVVSVAWAALIAVPLGYFIGHTGKGGGWMVSGGM